MLLATVSCTGEPQLDAPVAERAPSKSAQAKAPTTGPEPPRTSLPAELEPGRSCDDIVLGDLGPDWRSSAIEIGPVAFVSLKYAARQPPPKPPGARVAVYKTLAVVAPRSQVTVSIEPSARPYASLVYDAHQFRSDNRYQIQDGSPEVSFSGCPGREAQFNGSFLVDAPRCIPVRVVQQGKPVQRRVINFGARNC